jgi:catechol 2,3-dioxygenase-like lactoylglutathione lyase family enzyme
VHLGLVAIVVSEYEAAIRFFVDALGFELAEDSPAVTTDGRPKRWVVVRPRTEPYGQVAVFRDIAGKWDLIGPGWRGQPAARMEALWCMW